LKAVKGRTEWEEGFTRMQNCGESGKAQRGIEGRDQKTGGTGGTNSTNGAGNKHKQTDAGETAMVQSKICREKTAVKNEVCAKKGKNGGSQKIKGDQDGLSRARGSRPKKY